MTKIPYGVGAAPGNGIEQNQKTHTAKLSPDTLDLERTQAPKTSNKVTFHVSDVKPSNYYSNGGPQHRMPMEVLESTYSDTKRTCREIVYSSIGDGPSNSGTSDVVPNSYGFVGTVLRAYDGHFHLEIRPDDVWISIMTQFSFFINANAERFRSKFVTFAGKENIAVTAEIPARGSLNYGLFAVETAKLLEKAVVDPKLREWIVPQFSTTTLNDMIASSMVMMSTLKSYFGYSWSVRCGIPSVTLHGEKRDWEDLLKRIEALKEFGLETTMWYHLLEPILKRFVRAWDDPDGEWNKQFWGRVATTEQPYLMCGGGGNYITGWLTAFMPFNDKGKWQLNTALPNLKNDPEETEIPTTTREDYNNLSRYDFMRKYNTSASAYPNSALHEFYDTTEHSHPLSVRYNGFGIDVLGIKSPYPPTEAEGDFWEFSVDSSLVEGDVSWSSMELVIDGTWYPRHDKDDIPPSLCHVNVHMNEFGREYEAVVVAGVVGYHIKQIAKLDSHAGSNEQSAHEGVTHIESSLQPEIGWWIYEKKTEEEIKEWEAKRRRMFSVDFDDFEV